MSLFMLSPVVYNMELLGGHGDAVNYHNHSNSDNWRALHGNNHKGYQTKKLQKTIPYEILPINDRNMNSFFHLFMFLFMLNELEKYITTFL